MFDGKTVDGAAKREHGFAGAIDRFNLDARLLTHLTGELTTVCGLTNCGRRDCHAPASPGSVSHRAESTHGFDRMRDGRIAQP